MISTSEKIPYAVRLLARGVAGHGSVPLLTNPIVHLSKAVAKVADWQTPMRLNDTTRVYFERLATISTPEQAARYNGIVNPEKAEAIQQYFREHEPRHHSMLRTSISPNIVTGGFRVNVIPSTAEATLDIRALPDENMDSFLAELRRRVDDPNVEIVRTQRDTRPGAPPSRLDSEVFRAIEAAQKRYFPGAVTIPTMQTGATDMAYLRARGVQAYGVGPMIDEEDGPKGFGAHSDQERILEEALYSFVEYHWAIVLDVAASR
jgi:acetylornithine deacetylase/succinyl-diaminopimelate desuccinylase-like protein